MRFKIVLALLFFQLNLVAQDTVDEQFRFLINDMRQFFKETRGSVSTAPDSTRFFLSKITFSGSSDTKIEIADDAKSWAIYSTTIADSLNLKEAKRLSAYWRTIIETNAPGFVEDKSKGKITSTMGYPVYQWVYVRNEQTTEYSVFVWYSKGFIGKYHIMLQIGRQSTNFGRMANEIILTDPATRKAAIDSLSHFRKSEKFGENALGKQSYTGVHDSEKKAILTLGVNNAIDKTIAMLNSGPISIEHLYKTIKEFWKSGDASELRLDTDDAEVFYLYFVELYRYLGIEFDSDKIELVE